MKKFQAKRLLKFAKKLGTVSEKYFDIAVTWREEKPCGTVCCALGWACTMPEFNRAGLAFGKYDMPFYREYEFGQAGREFFGLTEEEEDSLFYWSGYVCYGEGQKRPTTKMVIDKIHRLVRTYHPELLEPRKVTNHA
jgi:hypothetical protein